LNKYSERNCENKDLSQLMHNFYAKLALLTVLNTPSEPGTTEHGEEMPSCTNP